MNIKKILALSGLFLVITGLGSASELTNSESFEYGDTSTPTTEYVYDIQFEGDKTIELNSLESPTAVEDSNGNELFYGSGSTTLNASQLEGLDQIVVRYDDTYGSTPSASLTETKDVTEPTGIEADSYSNAISFAEDYFEKPESLSCVATYAYAFGDCWVDFGIITWGDSSADVFIEDLKANGAIIEEDRNEVLNSLEVLNNQSYGIAQSGAKITAIEELNNGTSETDAQNKVRSDVKDFWAERQSNLVTQHQLEVQTFNQTIATADGVGADYSNMFDSNYTGFVIDEKTYQLVNGSEKTVYDVYADDNTLIHSYTFDSAIGLETVDGSEYLADGIYADKDSALVNLQSNAYQSANQLVTDIYANYEPGEITVGETVTALEETRHLATNYADSGATAYLAGTYRQMGLASDFNSSFKISYQNTDMTESQNLTGSLFAEEEGFSSGFEVGQTYDASDKTAYMIYQPENGSATSVTLNGNFTVEEIIDTSSGENLNSTEIQSNNFYESDISDLQAQLTEYQERIEELASGGAGGDSGGMSMSTYLIGALVLIIAGAFFS